MYNIKTMSSLVVPKCVLHSSKIIALKSDKPKKDKLFKSISKKFIKLNNYCDTKIKTSRLNMLIRNTNVHLNTRFEPLLEDYRDKTYRLVNIINIFCQMKCLDMYFRSKSNNYDMMDKLDFYDFLITLNQTIDEFRDIEN